MGEPQFACCALCGACIFAAFVYPATQSADVELAVLICLLVASLVCGLLCGLSSVFDLAAANGMMPSLVLGLIIIPSLFCSWLLAQGGYSVGAVIGMFFGIAILISCLLACLAGLAGLAGLASCAAAVYSMRIEEMRKLDKTMTGLLESGTIRLLSCQWLIDSAEGYAEAVRGLERCQDLPPEAFLSAQDAAEAYRGKSVYALSYGWLRKGMPDPDGMYLRTVVRYLRAPIGDLRRGLFWDFASLPQEKRSDDDEGTLEVARTGEEEAKFKQALASISILYGSLNTVALCVEEGPEKYDERPYSQRGWCIMESTVASFAAFYGKDKNLLQFIGQEIPPTSQPLERPDLREARDRVKRTEFTNGKDDKQKVLGQFTLFEGALRKNDKAGCCIPQPVINFVEKRT